MSGNPASSARRRSSSSGSQGQHNRDQPQVFSSSGIAHDIEQTRCDPLIEDMDHLTSNHDTEGPSSSKGKKGRGRNLKGLRPPENRESRTWVKLTDDKLQFADPSIPRAITTLWKSRFDGPYFTFDRVPNNKINEIYACFKTLYQWDRADNLHVRNAFINCMRHRWSDNMRDVRLKWVKDPSYIPCWMPPHLWSQLLQYWDSDEYKMLQARGAKNRNSGERVTHTTGSISFGIHEMRMTEARGGVQPPHQEKFKETHTFKKKVATNQEPMWINEKAKHRHDTYIAECSETHGSNASSWPRMDHEAWVKAIGGCSSSFMPGIGSQVNPEDVGFSYRKRPPRDNLMAAMMMSDFVEEQAHHTEVVAKQTEELERQHQQIIMMQQQLAQMKQAQNNMTEAQNNMSQTIAQSVAAALAAYGISPQAGHQPFASPQPSRN
ncbi:hypothetical protein SLEP1_g46452 [Rubroshorea leprosula]|uniref:Transposase, Ptta/En/Spm, plant n=1 Tax=Rubroshorea leprosula TaxID=152421 RepID=A0AAV5LMA5_9ROSI|nr:hypothetical protein SLEP1_g46452 [Rubroshorea leprosula]